MTPRLVDRYIPKAADHVRAATATFLDRSSCGDEPEVVVTAADPRRRTQQTIERTHGMLILAGKVLISTGDNL